MIMRKTWIAIVATVVLGVTIFRAIKCLLFQL